MDNRDWTEAVESWFARLLDSLIEYLPNVLGALVLVLAGWILARLLRAAVRRLGRRFDPLRSGTVESAMKRVGVERPAGEVIGSILYWTVLLFFVTAATEALGLPVIATWIGGLSTYLPRVLVGLLIVLAGLLAGALVRDAVARAAAAAGFAQAALLGQASQLVILVIALVTAVEQMGIDTEFLALTMTILIGAVIGGAALAFGLGARAHVANLIAAHYLRQVYREGQTVRVAGVEGTIGEILVSAVVLESAEGRVLVPAGEFSRTVSVLVSSEA